MAATMLEHLDTPPAQTWNRLAIDDVSLEVPTPRLAPQAVMTPVPPEVADIECGAGEAAGAWLTQAATQHRLVRVPEHAHPAAPVVIDVAADASTVCETNVIVGEGAQVSVVMVAAGTSDAATTSGSLLRLSLAEGARATLYELVALTEAQQVVDSVGISCADDAAVEVRQYVLGAGAAVVGLAADLAGDRSSIALSTRYLGRGTSLVDVNHVVRQRGRNTRAQLDETGALFDASVKTLRATIDLIRGCKGSRGREQETVLVSGDDVVNKTLPVILCDEDDVAGDHGATIGSVSPAQLDYLSGRGLTEGEAEELFSRAAFDDAVIHAPTDAARTATLDLAARVLGHEAAADLEADFAAPAQPDRTERTDA